MSNRTNHALAALVFAMLLAACGPDATPIPVEVAPAKSPSGPGETEVATVQSPSGPDLVVQSFEAPRTEWYILGGFGATVEVVVKNAGNEPASSFGVSIVGVNRESQYVRFDSTFRAELAPGQEVTLIGETGLYWHGHFDDVSCSDGEYDAASCAMHDENTLWLIAVADYCEGDEFPDHCEVDEIDEENNTSEPVVVKKPEADAPVPPADTPVPSTDTPVPPTPTPPPDAVVCCNALNVRVGPGVVYDRIGVVSQGDELKVVGQAFDCGWLKVLTPDGTLGWVSGKPAYITRNLNCSNIDPADFPHPPTRTPVPQKPLVIIMDGADRVIVYHAETYEAGGTNADDIAAILADLPVETRKETTSPQWQRAEQIRMLDPALVLIHGSAFYGDITGQMFDSFLFAMADAQTKFLIYSRGSGAQDEEGARAWYQERYGFLQGRVDVLHVPGGPGARWDVQGVGERLKDKVKSLLELR